MGHTELWGLELKKMQFAIHRTMTEADGLRRWWKLEAEFGRWMG